MTLQWIVMSGNEFNRAHPASKTKESIAFWIRACASRTCFIVSANSLWATSAVLAGGLTMALLEWFILWKTHKSNTHVTFFHINKMNKQSFFFNQFCTYTLLCTLLSTLLPQENGTVRRTLYNKIRLYLI